jgi:hypothetical protein
LPDSSPVYEGRALDQRSVLLNKRVSPVTSLVVELTNVLMGLTAVVCDSEPRAVVLTIVRIQVPYAAAVAWQVVERIQPTEMVNSQIHNCCRRRKSNIYSHAPAPVEGDKVIHHVDISWNEVWTGTDQIRLFEVNGDILTLETHIPGPR